MSQRLKFLLFLRYGNALTAIDRREGNILVYGSNGPIGSHHAGNTLKPAIIVGRKGSHGKVTWAPCGGFCIDTALFVDKSSCKGELRYAFYLLESLGLDRTSKDSAVPGLDRFEAHNITIPNHGLPTQKAIADFLDRETARIDQLIEKNRRFSSLANERWVSELNDSVFPTFPNWSHLPAEWEKVRLKYLIINDDKRCRDKHEKDNGSASGFSNSNWWATFKQRSSSRRH